MPDAGNGEIMAGRKCTICEHPKRKEIDLAIVREGSVLRTIAHQFDLSESALKRHVKKGHIADKIQKAAHAHEAADADDLLAEVQETEKITRFIISNSIKKTIKTRKDDGEEVEVKNPDYDPKIALQALARREKQIELKGRVLGSFKDGQNKHNPQTSPQPVAVTLNIAEEVKKLAGVLPTVKR